MGGVAVTHSHGCFRVLTAVQCRGGSTGGRGSGGQGACPGPASPRQRAEGEATGKKRGQMSDHQERDPNDSGATTNTKMGEMK